MCTNWRYFVGFFHTSRRNGVYQCRCSRMRQSHSRTNSCGQTGMSAPPSHPLLRSPGARVLDTFPGGTIGQHVILREVEESPVFAIERVAEAFTSPFARTLRRHGGLLILKVSRGVDVPPPHQPAPALRPFVKLRDHKFGERLRVRVGIPVAA